MNQHVSQVTELINRNLVVSLLLKQGYNVFLPVYDDGIDFVLHRRRDDHMVKVRLKSRWTIDRKYAGRDISIAFPHRSRWYLVPHDDLVRLAPQAALSSASWLQRGIYHSASPSAETMRKLERFRLEPIEAVAQDAASSGNAADAYASDRRSNRAALDRLAAMRRALPRQSPLTVEEILGMRDEGRSA